MIAEDSCQEEPEETGVESFLCALGKTEITLLLPQQRIFARFEAVCFGALTTNRFGKSAN